MQNKVHTNRKRPRTDNTIQDGNKQYYKIKTKNFRRIAIQEEYKKETDKLLDILEKSKNLWLLQYIQSQFKGKSEKILWF